MEISKKDATFLGVDLGGTKLLIGETDINGRLLRHKKYESGTLAQADALERIDECLADYMLSARPKNAGPPIAIGMGLVGRVDVRRGVWLGIDHKRTDEVDISEFFKAKYGVPCFIDNDVRSATKAEMTFGKGRHTKNMIYINVGTGIAAGIVSDARLIMGGHYNAGEVGHTASGVVQRAECVCGRPDCVEAIASGSGFDKCARAMAPLYKDSLLPIPPKGTRVDVCEVFNLYNDDAMCRAITDSAAQALANLIMNLVRVSDPDTVVLGGGVMSDGFLYHKVQELLSANTMRFVTNGVVLTQLDAAFVGLLGACSNAIIGMEP